MPQLEINLPIIEKLIDQLNEKEKIKLVRRLEAKTCSARWKALLARIDQRRGKYPLKQNEIAKITEQARQEIYERNRR